MHWSTSAEGTTQDVACPDAHYLLIEFEAAECALDARASLMVTGSDGACVAHVTGTMPSCRAAVAHPCL